MQATDLYSRIYTWCKNVLGNTAVVYQAYQNMPMKKGHVLVIDPAPRIDKVMPIEQGNPDDMLHGSQVLRMSGSMTLTEIGGYNYLYTLVRNLQNPYASTKLNSSDLVVKGMQGPVSVPNIDDASSEWYAEQTLVLSMDWLDVDMTPVDGGLMQSIHEVVADRVDEEGTTLETLDIIDDSEIAAMTLRFSFSDPSYNPQTAGVGSDGTWVQVGGFPLRGNVWEWTCSSASWASKFLNAFADPSNIVRIIAAGDTSAVTSLYQMFKGCSSLAEICLFDTSHVTSMSETFNYCRMLTTIPLLDTGSVTDMSSMFYNCTSLTTIPLLNTSSVTTLNYMFYNCRRVESGALAIYQQASGQATPPTNHSNTFSNCGSSTTTGLAEIRQIPSSWGGLLAALGSPSSD